MASAHKQAYDKIRNAIIKGTFGPGYHLREEELTEFCKTSRTPVRQAIRTLEKQGIVMFGENRRSYVPDVDENAAEEAFDLLAYLESYSAGLAARKITQQQIDEIKRIQDRFDVMAAKDRVGKRPVLEVNGEFHAAIHKANGNAMLQEMILKASGLTFNLYIKYGIIGDPESATKEHWELIHALERNDIDFAMLRMRLHVESVRRVYRRHWTAQNSE